VALKRVFLEKQEIVHRYSCLATSSSTRSEVDVERGKHLPAAYYLTTSLKELGPGVYIINRTVKITQHLQLAASIFQDRSSHGSEGSRT
jgi:hypothetical protein